MEDVNVRNNLCASLMWDAFRVAELSCDFTCKRFYLLSYSVSSLAHRLQVCLTRICSLGLVAESDDRMPAEATYVTQWRFRLRRSTMSVH